MGHGRGWALIATALVVMTARAASANEESPQSPKRAVPDYDGRGPDPSNTDGAGTWTARVLLSPLYLTSEWIIRRPLGGLMTAAERADLPNKLYDFFTFGPNHDMGFYPVGFAAFGFLPSVGVYAFWNNAFVEKNDVRLHVETWPGDWFYASMSDRYTMGEGSWLRVRASALTRPDMTFYGIGPSTLESARSRFTERRFDANATLDDHFWRSSELQGVVGVRKVETSHGHFGSDPSVEVAAANGAYPLPWGFDRDYLAPYVSLNLALDTRKPRGSRTGVRVEAYGEEGVDLQHDATSSWVRYGATLAAHVDTTGTGRVLSLKGGVLFADPMSSDSQVPFTELVTLGGEKWMRGYFPGRLVDRSAAIVELSYAWPVAASFEATIHADVGNVFGPHLDGFKPELLRFSGSLGLASKLANPPFEFVIGFGTETFQHGGQVDSIRLAVGVPLSF